jgi:hypothetical protein
LLSDISYNSTKLASLTGLQLEVLEDAKVTFPVVNAGVEFYNVGFLGNLLSNLNLILDGLTAISHDSLILFEIYSLDFKHGVKFINTSK